VAEMMISSCTVFAFGISVYCVGKSENITFAHAIVNYVQSFSNYCAKQISQTGHEETIQVKLHQTAISLVTWPIIHSSTPTFVV
jgi:23S rRNA pseudoU1915 N3-methylase RlmH